MRKLTKKVKSDLLDFLLQEPLSFGEPDNNEGIIPFLNEIWDLKAMPSTDKRFGDAYGDIYQHTINNNDWDLDFLFIEVLKVLEDDVHFQKFIETVVSPKYRINEDEISSFVIGINKFLIKDSLQLAIVEYNEDGLPKYTIQNKEEVDDLPLNIKLNDVPFYVVKTPKGKAWNKDSHIKPGVTPSLVLVFNDGWNDYRVWSEFYLYYYDQEGHCNYIGTTKIIFDEELNTPEFIPDDFLKLSQNFCSLGQHIEYYTNLKKCVGKDFEGVLYALRDAAFFPQIHELFEKHKNFINSLIREDTAERLLREAKHIINESDFSTLYTFKYRFQPPFSKTPIDIDFNFNGNSEIPDRIYGLIGKNGTGKTQLVTSLPHRISRKESQYFNPKIPLFSKVIAVSYSVFDKFEIPKRTASFNYIYCGLRNEESEFITERGLILRFHKSWKRIEELRRINKWRKILLNFIDEELVNQFLVSKEHIQHSSNKYDVDVKAFSKIKGFLSSGQSIILYIVTEIIAHIRLDSLLIYDEPETHLHPNAITQLMNTIYDLVHEFESYCIIATHSPLVIRELFSKNVYVIERHGNTPSARRIAIESFGENLSTLTDEVFGNKEVPKQYKKIIQELVNGGDSYENIVTALESDDVPLSLNARLFIKSQIKAKNEKA